MPDPITINIDRQPSDYREAYRSSIKEAPVFIVTGILVTALGVAALT